MQNTHQNALKECDLKLVNCWLSDRIRNHGPLRPIHAYPDWAQKGRLCWPLTKPGIKQQENREQATKNINANLTLFCKRPMHRWT
jgi:hypothetical protein